MKNSNKSKTSLAITSLVVFIITMVVNYGAMFGWFGQTQEAISNQYKNFVTPSSFTFSIWGVIYILVLASLIYQIYLAKKDRYDANFFDKFNKLFIAVNIFNIGWNLLWVSDYIALSTVLIFAFTITLAIINTHILKNYSRSYSKVIPIAFAIYFGWLTVATVTNVAALLVKVNWGMFGIEEHLIACLTYIFTAILAGLLIKSIKNPVFNLPILWAFFGIYSALKELPSASLHWGMPYVILGVAIALVAEMIFIYVKNDKKILP